MLRKPDSASAVFMLTATIWLVVGVLMGLVLALELVFPDMTHGISWLVFGRLRPAHTSTVMFAFLSGGMMGIWLHIVPRLTGRQLWSEPLAHLCALLWNGALLIGIVALLNGYIQSREYAELVWGIDVAVMVVLILNMINIYMTVAYRTEQKFYVSM
jgi:cytochrome c oxidase cbb3-type subunit I